MVEAAVPSVPVKATTRVLGWSVIALIGGTATIASLVILLAILLVADVFVLEKTPVQTSYLTIVRQKGLGSGGGGTWYIYQLKDDAGTISDMQLPWVAQPGDRLRVRTGRTRILRLTIPTEGPVLCSAAQPCEP